MTVFWLNLSFVYFFSFFSRYFSKPASIRPATIRPSYILAAFVIATLVLVSGFRNNIGDTYYYMLSYKIADFNLATMKFEGDFGFNVMQSLLHRISDDPQLLIFTTALITNVLIVLVLYQYSRMIELAMFVYITSGMFMVSMNGIRQYFAAAIVFTATKYVLNGDWKKYILIVLFASTFHQTALILIPIYFVVRREAWTKVTFLLLFAAVILAIGFNQFSAILYSAVENTHYGQYKDFSEGGASVLRVTVNSVPILFAYLGREKLRELWPKSDYIVNLALLGSVFLIISTQNWIFARFNIYFGLYNLILISWVVKLFTPNYRKLMYYSVLICYFCYYYYEQVLSLHMEYKSDYFTFF